MRRWPAAARSCALVMLVTLGPLLSVSAQVFPLPIPTRPTSFPLPIPNRPAIKGTAVAWGRSFEGQTNVPVGLSNVVAVAGATFHSLVLKDDGTVVSWGQSTVSVSLTGVVAVAAGGAHNVVLKSNGTVAAWGNNSLGQTNVPAGLSNVVAAGAGNAHSLALKNDGTVVAWGANQEDGETNVPAGLSNVVAIAVGSNHNLALKHDGTVVAWGWNYYGQINVPAALSNVVAVAASINHNLALKSDGTVVSWGWNALGQTNVPAGLSNVVAVAAGFDHSLALKNDGTVVAWGKNQYGEGAVPAGLSNVVTIASGAYHNLALAAYPTITAIGANQTVNSGATVSFTVSASGPPLSYQWRKDGTNLVGATNSILTLTNVTTADAGGYTVRVSNPWGSEVSPAAVLKVFNLAVDGLAAGHLVFRPGPAVVSLASYFPGGFMFYTLDGSAPTTSSTLYSGPFTVSNSVTVRVLALSSDFLQSEPGPAVDVQIVPFYPVSLTTPGGGSGAVSPALASYPSNSVVTLTATPNSGWSFLRWEGDAAGTSHPLALTVNAAKTVRAIFGTPVARNVVGGGVVLFEPERIAYDFGSKLRATAIPNAGNYFVVWSGALSGSTNAQELTVTQPGQTVSALFTALAGNQVSLVVRSFGPGSVAITPYKNAYTLGEVARLEAVPADGTNQLLVWAGDLTGTSSPVDVTMNASKIITAFFGVPGPLRCFIFSTGSNAVRVSWNTKQGIYYEIQTVTNLTGTWSNLYNPAETFIAFTNVLERFVPVDGGARFFRISELSTNNIPAGMVLVPAGSFIMGDTLSDSDWPNGTHLETPAHSVHVSAFYMDRFEVTKALWDEVYQWSTNHGYSFEFGAAGKAENHPAQSVMWYDAVKWCNARSEKEGRIPAYYTDAAQTTVYRSGQVNVQNDWVKWDAGYRLPTEAEWEKAARGGASGRRFPWADVDTITHSRANYYSYWVQGNPYYSFDVNSTQGYHLAYNDGVEPYTSPVGSFAANGYGLYDMVGNVYEWCWDWLDWYSGESQIDPHGPASSLHGRAFRGGCWNSFASNCRSAFRNLSAPVASGLIGFRSVLPSGQ